MITPITDLINQILQHFFPADLIAIPFFAFLMNCFQFFYCAMIFSLFFIFPLWVFFKFIKKILGRWFV